MGWLVGKHCFSHKYNIFFFRFLLLVSVSTQILATVPFDSRLPNSLLSEFQVLSIPKPYRAIFFGYACYGTGAVLHFLLSAFARKSCCSTADSMNRLCDSTILEFFSFLGFVSAYRLTVLLCCCDCYGWEIPTQYYTQQIFLHKNVAL